MTNDQDRFEAFKKMVLEAEGQDDAPPNADEAFKDELLRQHRDDRFGVDGRSDEEVWQAAMKDEQFKAALRGEGGQDAR